jgi:hypothetical protein
VSQGQFHSIIGNLEASFSRQPMLLTVFIEDGIGVVDVDENFAAFGIAWELREQAVASGERKMTHFAGGSLAASNRNEFVIRPKSSVQESDIAGSGGFHSLGGTFRQARRITERLSGLFEAERHNCFLGWQTAAELRADEIRIVATE